MAQLQIVTALAGGQQVQAGLKSIETEMGRLGTAANQNASRINGAFSGITSGVNVARTALAALGVGIGVETVARIGRFITANLDAAGSLGELAQQAGTSTKFLQELTYGAAQAGIGASEMQNSLAILSRTIGDAVAGSAEAVDAFERLGIEVRDSGGAIKSSEEIVLEASDAISRMSSAAEQSAAAADLFGRSGARLLPLLTQGSQGFRDLAAAAAAAGAVLSDEAIAAADESSDRLAVLDLQLTKLSQSFAVVFAPAVSAAAESLSGFLGELATAPGIFDKAIVAGEAWLTLLYKMQTAPAGMVAGQLKSWFEPDLEGLGVSRNPFDTMTTNTLPIPDVKPLAEAEEFLARVAEAAAKAREESAKAAAQTQQSVDAVTAALQFEIASWSMTAEQIAIVTNLQKAGIAVDDERAASIIDLTAQIERHREGMEHFQESLQREIDMWEQHRQGMSDAGKEAGTVTREMSEGFGVLGQTMADSISQGAMGMIEALRAGESAFDSLANVALRALDNILNSLIEAGIQALIFGTNIGSGLSAGPPGTSRKGGTSGFGFGDILGIASLFAGFFATGTDRMVSRPTLMMVGENGTEHVSVKPAGAAGRGNGMTVINLDLRGSNGDASIQRAVQEGLRRALPTFVETSVQAVRNGQRRDMDFFG